MFTALSQKLVDSGWMGKISIPYSLKMNRIKNIDYVYFSYFSTALLKHHDQETYKKTACNLAYSFRCLESNMAE